MLRNGQRGISARLNRAGSTVTVAHHCRRRLGAGQLRNSRLHLLGLHVSNSAALPLPLPLPFPLPLHVKHYIKSTLMFEMGGIGAVARIGAVVHWYTVKTRAQIKCRK